MKAIASVLLVVCCGFFRASAQEISSKSVQYCNGLSFGLGLHVKEPSEYVNALIGASYRKTLDYLIQQDIKQYEYHDARLHYVITETESPAIKSVVFVMDFNVTDWVSMAVEMALNYIPTATNLALQQFEKILLSFDKYGSRVRESRKKNQPVIVRYNIMCEKAEELYATITYFPPGVGEGAAKSSGAVVIVRLSAQDPFD
jgi:hypothetical protein